MNSDDQLRELARLAGVEAGYWDIRGTHHEASPEVLRAHLGALGIEAESEARIRESIAALAQEDWLTLSPAVLVVRQSREVAVPLCIPQSRDSQTLSWTLALEDGTQSSGEVPVKALTQEAAHDADGRKIIRRWLALPPAPTGYHTLSVRLADEISETQLIIAPSQCYLPPVIAGGEKRWGVSAQLYGLRSRRNWGIGDFTDIGTLSAWAARQGADITGLSPLHALFRGAPDRAGPYSPNSRLFLNPLYIDVTALEDMGGVYGSGNSLASPSNPADTQVTDHVDYTRVAAVKLPAFESAYANFCALLAQDPRHPRALDFQRFRESRGESLDRFAVFEALSETFESHDWASWSQALRDPGSAEVQEFARARAERVCYHEYLQWQADVQLSRAASDARGNRMSIGLYLDLAISSDPSGADVWGAQDSFALGARIGAPPDPFAEQGQEWGVVPMNPRQLRRMAYAPIAELWRANMRHAGALRIDHAMGLQRLFWIPVGEAPSAGTYVRYPMEDLLGVLALESHRNQCLIIGEDLGTVPEGFRERMEQERVLSYRVLYFERDESAFKGPQAYPALAMACVTTHDLATLRGFWNGEDLETRNHLGLYQSPEEFQAARAERAQTKRLLIDALESEGLLPVAKADLDMEADLSDELAGAVHGFAARTSSILLMAQLEDLVGQAHQANVPGTSSESVNWRRRLPIDIEDLENVARARQVVKAIARER